MKNVTPTPPPAIDPRKAANGSYAEGYFDAQLEAAEKNYWFSHGYRIDRHTGKLIEIHSMDGGA